MHIASFENIELYILNLIAQAAFKDHKQSIHTQYYYNFLCFVVGVAVLLQGALN